jgi:signal recognition particle subunit SEC65
MVTARAAGRRCISFRSRRAHDKQQLDYVGDDYLEQLGNRSNFRRNVGENMAVEPKEIKLISTADLIQAAAARLPAWPNPKVRWWEIELRRCAVQFKAAAGVPVSRAKCGRR